MGTPRDLSNFLKDLKRTLFQRRTMQRFGETTKDIIFKRTKSGFGVDNDRIRNPRKKRLKGLSPEYIRQRQKRGVRGQFGSPSRSNLTNTGQLLDSIRVSATSRGFKVSIPNTPRKRVGNESRVPSNRDVANFVRKERAFFALTRAEQRIVEREVGLLVRRVFRRHF